MNMVQYDLQFATVSVPAEVSHEEIRSTVANVVTDAGTKAKNTTTTTAKGVIDSIGVITLIVCVVVAYLVITNAQAVWAWATSFVK